MRSVVEAARKSTLTRLLHDRHPLPVPIMVTITAVHAARSAPIDAALWGGITVALLAESAALHRYPDRRPATGPVLRVVDIAVVVGLVGIGGRPVGGRRLAAVADRVRYRNGCAAAGVRHSRTGARRARDPPAWPWLCLLVAICLMELTSFLQQPDLSTGSAEHPTLSVLIGPLLDSTVVRGCTFGCWILAGCYLLRRAGLLRSKR